MQFNSFVFHWNAFLSPLELCCRSGFMPYSKLVDRIMGNVVGVLFFCSFEVSFCSMFVIVETAVQIWARQNRKMLITVFPISAAQIEPDLRLKPIFRPFFCAVFFFWSLSRSLHVKVIIAEISNRCKIHKLPSIVVLNFNHVTPHHALPLLGRAIAITLCCCCCYVFLRSAAIIKANWRYLWYVFWCV